MDPERPEPIDDGAVVGEIVEAAPGADEGPFGLGSDLDLGAMMQMAQDMGERMQAAQEELAAAEVVGTAGGGIVEVTLNGHLHLVRIHIDPAAMDRDDPTMLEDLVTAAWTDAHAAVARLQAGADPLGGLGGSGDLSGLGGLFGGT